MEEGKKELRKKQNILQFLFVPKSKSRLSDILSGILKVKIIGFCYFDFISGVAAGAHARVGTPSPTHRPRPRQDCSSLGPGGAQAGPAALPQLNRPQIGNRREPAWNFLQR